MVRINKIKNINVYSNSDGAYILHNTKKPFKCGHTHINNYHTALYIAKLVAFKKMPKNNHLSDYLFNSIIRLSDDINYINQIQNIKRNSYHKK